MSSTPAPGLDAFLAELFPQTTTGALVHATRDASGHRVTSLLDMTPQSHGVRDVITDFADAALAVGRTFRDPTGVTITVGEATPKGLTIDVTLDPILFRPGQLTATRGTDAEAVILTWSSSVLATRYVVWWGPRPSGPYDELATTLEPTWRDTGARPGMRYWYVVTGLNDTVTSLPSQAVEGWRAPTPFVRGDATGDGRLDISDPIRILSALFMIPAGRPTQASDANDDGAVNLSDAIVLLNFLFLGRSTPPAPYPLPGFDPTP